MIVIDYQVNENEASEVLPLHEYEKIYDGSIRFFSDDSEEIIRHEIVRLIQNKQTDMYNFTGLAITDIDFVRCSNKRVRGVDGDVPFDANGIKQFYRNGGLYVRFNTGKFAIMPGSESVSIYVFIPSCMNCACGTSIRHA